MAYLHHEELDVYKLAYALAKEVHHASLTLPKFEQYGGMADQMRRASRSICANLAEGLGKFASLQEENRFLSMALGSCAEMRVWLQFGCDFGYVDTAICQNWLNDYERVSKMIFALMQARKQRDKVPA